MNRVVKVLVLIVVCAALGLSVACAKKPPAAAPPPPPPPAAPPPPPPPPPPPKPAPEVPKPPTEDEIFARKTLAELNAEQPLADVYFNYDKADLSEPARTALQRNADWLKRWTSTRIAVEGHCDSRGTNEYNIGLGERRAAAVRDYLVSLGVSGDRVMSVSKGEESPFCTEEDEACWSQNRRGHFILTGK